MITVTAQPTVCLSKLSYFSPPQPAVLKDSTAVLASNNLHFDRSHNFAATWPSAASFEIAQGPKPSALVVPLEPVSAENRIHWGTSWLFVSQLGNQLGKTLHGYCNSNDNFGHKGKERGSEPTLTAE
jgi:hypothetical protein